MSFFLNFIFEFFLLVLFQGHTRPFSFSLVLKFIKKCSLCQIWFFF